MSVATKIDRFFEQDTVFTRLLIIVLSALVLPAMLIVPLLIPFWALYVTVKWVLTGEPKDFL